MLVDDIKIRIKAGNGGRGAVAFNKNLMSLGPTGGDGGNGGSVYFEGVSNLNALAQFRYKKDIKIKNGENGKPQFNDGARSEDLTLKIPIGTVITNLDTGESSEITKVGERVLAAKGGKGGKGNFKFRSSINTTPMEFQKGLAGESFSIQLELKLIADVGLIGLPNAGKSSLLNELTRAHSKVANYPFTTLEPNMGAYYELILADIPGIIEGASAGRGLGVKFLRHIERTKILFHLVSAESENLVKDYKVIRNELKTYGGNLAKKQEYLFLTKSDLVAPAELKKKLAGLKKTNKNTLALSIHDWDSLEKVKKILNKIQEEKLH
ncbi:MAG: GTPase ObgE [Candidatus Sungbacteria bacterium]|uniref:GTPase Obg n=1 Tax=Candidatus Sungiibacteriota bacterium TaxID=2750080 RepID=A0A9D6DRZ9_9BACT|nr:GTPase ObgE [Candidatus Sungbacteria bacterium]